MAYEQKDNSGALFANAKRETEKHPNATGSAMIGGVEYWVSAWTNTSSKGTKYQSLKFERKSEAFDNTAELRSEGSYDPNYDTIPNPKGFNDDVPF